MFTPQEFASGHFVKYLAALLLMVPTGLRATDWPVTPSADANDDATVRINAAINSASAHLGDRVILQPLSTYYLISGSIVPKNNTILSAENTTWIKRKWDGGNVNVSGAMINPVSGTGANNVTIAGGTWTNIVGTIRYTGRVINLIGDNWMVKNMKVTSWGKPGSPSILVAPMGSNIEIFNLDATGCPPEVGNAGIRVLYGTNISVHDCYIESGDDTYCAFPVEYNTAFGANRVIDGVTFERCNGKSFMARFLACGKTQNDPNDATWNDASVKNITFSNCVGSSVSTKTGVPGIYSVQENHHAGALVQNIKFLNGCKVQPSSVATRGAYFRCIANADLRDIRVENSTIGPGTNRCVEFAGAVNGSTKGLRNVTVTGCTLDGDSGSQTQPPVKADNVGTFSLTYNTIDRPGTAAGWSVTSCTGFTQNGNTLQ